MLTTTGEERQVLRLKSKSLAVGMKGMQFSKDAESVARRVKEVNAERLEIDKQTGDFQERTLENLTREENRLLELIEPITQINMLKAQQLKIEKDIKETQNVNEDVDVEPFTKDEDAEFFGEDEKKSFGIKRDLLGKHGLNFDKVVFAKGKDKWQVDVDYLIDDSPNNYNYWFNGRQDDDGFILLDRPYNQKIKPKHRVSNLREAEEIIL